MDRHRAESRHWAKSGGTGTPVEGIVATGVPVKDPTYGTSSKKNGEGICPAAIGFKDQQPSAYSPITGLFYVIACDPMKGSVVWEIKENLAAYGGALTTAGGLVFYGTMEGWLKASTRRPVRSSGSTRPHRASSATASAPYHFPS